MRVKLIISAIPSVPLLVTMLNHFQGIAIPGIMMNPWGVLHEKGRIYLTLRRNMSVFGTISDIINKDFVISCKMWSKNV